jgi:hypothetical protein
MFVRIRRLFGLAAIGTALMFPRGADAQVGSTFQACTTGSLVNCAIIRLTAKPGLFEIALRNAGSGGLATSINYLAFVTGIPAASPDNVSTPVTPTAHGGATISDPSDWGLFESGDFIVLSPSGNNGVGGCDSAPPSGAFGQMGQTCAPNAFVKFSFSTPRSFDPRSMSLADLEVTASDGSAASCVDSSSCSITAVTTPEPATIALVLTGLVGIAGIRLRRRKAFRTHALNAGEV